ncbi:MULTISPECIES: SEL1-like repeat protein [unclassified Desulfovibrio]|uniref:SEL1-like repeat protein n=1 Tax=unclassified Desulfovibrio TaxID=2593640 RepID=UPI0013E9BD04|nr:MULTISPECIES: SEL1-like repeat protein [unclassified Desulfovibrio]
MASQPSEVLEFLSKFLPLANDWSGEWNRFAESVRELEESLVFPSAYPGKRAFRKNMDFLLKRLFFFCRFPWLGGKCLIGRIGYREPLSVRHGLPAIVSIPILYAPQVETTLYTPQGSALDYPREEIPRILHAIRTSSGDVDALFSLIAVRDASLPKDAVLVDFPSRCQPENLFFKPLLAAAEQIKLFPSGVLSREAERFLQSRRPLFPVWVEPAHEKFAVRLPRKADEPRPDWRCGGYIPFQFLCECFLAAPQVWSGLQGQRLGRQEGRLTEDLILNDADRELKKHLAGVREKCRSALEQLGQWQARYADAAKKIGEMAAALDTRIAGVSKVQPLTGIAWQHNNDWSVAETHLLDLVSAGNPGAVVKFTAALADKGYPYPGILASARAALGDGSPDASIAGMDNRLAHVLTILLRDRLGLGIEEAGKSHAWPLVAECPDIADRLPELYFAAGVAFCHEGNTEAGTEFLRKALKNGHEAAGKTLYDHARLASDEKTIKFLANHLVPAACYDMALAGGREPSRGRGLFYLYAAAARGHVDALRALASEERIKSFRNSLTEEQKKVHRLHAIGIYRRLEEMRAPLSSKELCELGSMLNYERRYQEAFNYLSQSREAHAYCLLGRMYHYGNGVSIDVDKARLFYGKAIEGGDSRAPGLLEKLDAHERRRRQARSRGTDYHRKEETVSSSSSGGGGCFLTTATCRAKGLPDDCDVLTAYRRFRDEILLATGEGRALVAEYYRIAPDIVRVIESRPDSEKIYATMWEEYLEPGYRLVLEHKNSAAKELYIQLVRWLAKNIC